MRLTEWRAVVVAASALMLLEVIVAGWALPRNLEEHSLRRQLVEAR